uniref:Uncharacterized protein n=1 Tax=Romanomermis culicivorax TaxID=13658 RepID=A0A915IWA0_ROMCU
MCDEQLNYQPEIKSFTNADLIRCHRILQPSLIGSFLSRCSTTISGRDNYMNDDLMGKDRSEFEVE